MPDDLSITRLVLIRHAEAQAARGDSDLTERGLWQTERLRNRLAVSGELRTAAYLVTSTLRRAVHTADGISRSLGPAGLEARPDGRLVEMEISVETWSDFEARARGALRAYADLAVGSMAVLVCHTGIIEASMIEFGGLAHRSQRFGMQPRHTSLTTWVSADGGNGRHWRLESYNDCAHLWSEDGLGHEPEAFDILASGVEPFWLGVGDGG